MNLLNLQTLFEFFLVLYAGYMVSNEIKKVIDLKVINLLKGHTYLINKAKKELLELIEGSREICGVIESFPTTPESAFKVKSYLAKMTVKLDDLEAEVASKYGHSDPHLLFESETQFTNVFKPYSYFFTIYCFLILFVGGYPPLLENNGFYESLFVFNCLSFAFIVGIFGMSFKSSRSLKNHWIFLIFLSCFVISTWVFKRYDETLLIPLLKNSSIILSVILAISPIFIYILRIQFCGAQFKNRMNVECAQYRSKITVVKSEIHNTTNASQAFAEFSKMKTEQFATTP
ncbi:MAG: hypothetical protein V4608_05385 [Bacteroidota bacterium]